MTLFVWHDVNARILCCFLAVILGHSRSQSLSSHSIQLDAAGICPRLEPEEVRNSRRIGSRRCVDTCADHGDCTSGYKCCPIDSCKRCIQPIPSVISKSGNPVLESTVSKDSFGETRVMLICHGQFNPYTTLYRWYRNGFKFTELGGIDGSSHTFLVNPGTNGTYACSVNTNVDSNPEWLLSNEKSISLQEEVTEQKPCPRNSLRRPCGCPRTCARPLCREQCAVGGMCLCQEGLVMHEDQCIPETRCPNGQGDCNGPNESYADCGHLCTCSQYKARGGRCGTVCGQGPICVCNQGYIRQKEGGQCISERSCRSGAVTTGSVGTSGTGGSTIGSTCPPPRPIPAAPRGCYYQSVIDKIGCSSFKLQCLDGFRP